MWPRNDDLDYSSSVLSGAKEVFIGASFCERERERGGDSVVKHNCLLDGWKGGTVGGTASLGWELGLTEAWGSAQRRGIKEGGFRKRIGSSC